MLQILLNIGNQYNSNHFQPLIENHHDDLLFTHNNNAALRGHNWVHFTIGHSVMLLCFEFKLRYLKYLKLFSIRVKKLFEP